MPAAAVMAPGSSSRRVARAGVALALLVLLLTLVSPRSLARTSDEPSTVDLLSIEVRSWDEQAYAEFNDVAARAIAGGEAWPRDPVLLVRRYAGADLPRRFVWTIEGTGERPSRYRVVIISDGLPDDSVRGRRLEISLERMADASWRITGARVSWRCWPGRGRAYFGNEPCS